MDAILFSRKLSSRLDYISDYVCSELLGIKVHTTTDVAEYKAFAGLAVNYSADKVRDDEIHIFPHQLLFQEGVEEQAMNSFLWEGLPVCFGGKPGHGDLPFDPFANSFFLLTRYEEYLSYIPDQHGRYPAALSWASRNNCLDRPMVWEWTKTLVPLIQRRYSNWQPAKRTYQFLPSFDIDIPWAYRHRGLRGIARAGLDLMTLKWEHWQARLAAFRDAAKDPFYTFDDLEKLHEEHGIKARVFWLLGDASREDINPSYQLEVFQNLIQSVSAWSEPGIHPSYYSWQDSAKVEMEKRRLEHIVGQQISNSRQHYLRLRLPDTYRALIAASILHDYSMGFAARPGYRAGTTEPFRWYDLEREQVSHLWVHPFAVMDVTLKQYLGLSAKEAGEKLHTMQSYCRQEGLSFSTLWHNSSFSAVHGWGGWWEVYTALYG